MIRYIDADKLRKDEIARCHCVPCVGSNDNNYKDLDEVLNDAPTADVVEVRHGRWTLHTDGSGTCSECGTTQKNVWDCDRWQNYCGHCGAKMDGERKGGAE